jgi:peptidoglycan/LPS O-acetylase OafA/YrhL
MTALAHVLEPAAGKAAFVAHPYRLLGSYRFLLAILVLLSHTSSFTAPFIHRLALGNVGVMLFFVVSGFVISEACDVFYRGRTWQFLANRALKIFPAYWAATMLAYAIFTGLDRSAAPDIPELSFAPWPLLVNASLLLAYLKQGNTLLAISQAWAVLIECQFYLIAALVFAAAGRLPRGFLGWAAATALIAYVAVWQTGTYGRFFGGFIHAPFFVLGGVAYVGLTRPGIRGLRALLVAALVLSLHAYVAYNARGLADPLAGEAAWNLLATGCLFALGLCLFAALAPRRASPQFERLDKRLGDITYALYLVHHPIAELAVGLGLRGLPGFAAILAASLGAATLIHRLVERPAMGLRDALRGVRLYA